MTRPLSTSFYANANEFVEKGDSGSAAQYALVPASLLTVFRVIGDQGSGLLFFES
jgi:hypothetical protein